MADFMKSDFKGEYLDKIKRTVKDTDKFDLHKASEQKFDVKLTGKGGAKKARGLNKEAIYGVTKPAIRRMARRGGVKRISGLMYAEIRQLLKQFVKKAVRDSIAYCEHGRRSTVRATDTLNALQLQGRGMYGL